MFAVGHIALGYLAGKFIGLFRGRDLNMPALLTFALLPDVDLLVPGLQHRGPTHSLLFIAAMSVPILLVWSGNAFQYIIALSTHSLIGDVFTDGGTQLLWPFSREWVMVDQTLMMGCTFEVYMEIALFTAMIGVMLLSGDLSRFLKPSRKNLLLGIPISTIVLPALFEYPVRMPTSLMIPHILLLALIGLSFTISVIKPEKI